MPPKQFNFYHHLFFKWELVILLDRRKKRKKKMKKEKRKKKKKVTSFPDFFPAHCRVMQSENTKSRIMTKISCSSTIQRKLLCSSQAQSLIVQLWSTPFILKSTPLLWIPFLFTSEAFSLPSEKDTKSPEVLRKVMSRCISGTFYHIPIIHLFPCFLVCS